MQYLGADDGSQITGVGYAGEVHQGPDGRLYEWVEGVDAWGGQLGFWQGLPQVRVDDPAVNGLGALYEAPDGSLYQMRGPDEDAPEAPSAEDDKEDDQAAPKMGPGRQGEIRVGPDGKKYRWIVGVGPGGHRHGFWRRLRPHPRFQRSPVAAHPRPGAPPRPGAHPPRRHRAAPPSGRRRKPILGRILKIAKGVSSLIPGVGTAVAAGLTVATPLLKKAGVAGYEGLGALYEAPDGSLYALHGFAEEDLHGLYETDGIDDLSAADDLNGLALDEDFQGPQAYDVQGADPASDAHVGADDPLQGYVNEDQMAGLQAYVPEPPRRTPMFEAPCVPPRVWKPHW